MFSLSTQMALYGILLLAAWLLSWRIPETGRRELLYLVISYVLYATWGLGFLGILVASSLMNYALGRYLGRRPSVQKLWVGIGCNVLLLSLFKYLPGVGRMAPHSPLALVSHLVLPVGMSFWTFQALSYLIDIYREEELNPSLLEFCLYMAFWPTALSGPICRLPSLLPQFREEFAPVWKDLETGFRRIVIGLLMMVLSQFLAAGLFPQKGLDAAYALPAARLSGLDVWMMLAGYGFQLFFNFCGYSHLVIGAARLFGLELHENFNHPFLSTSPSEYWTRWHMSLSFWIRDYMFFPLATLRAGVGWRNLCLVIAMFVFGLWHKGSVLFMIWGTYHGVLLVVHRQWQQFRLRTGFRPLPSSLAKPASWALTFAAICLSWVFFRAADLHQASAMLRAAFTPRGFLRIHLPLSLYGVTFALGAGYFLILRLAQLLDGWQPKSGAAPGFRAQLLSGDRWVWVAPIFAVVSFYIFLLIRPTISSAAPMLYGLF